MEPIIQEIQVKSVLTKSNLPVSDYSVNPYVGCTHACRYCYASFMKRFTCHPEPWGTFLDVKHWPEIKHPERYAGKELFIGSVTDPYLPQEEVFGRTRALLEQLKGSGVKISITTKSDLVLRDLDLIKTFPDARVSWSVNTLDEGFKNDMDNAVSIGRRLTAMKAFHDAGIRTTCFVSPIFPGITDVKAIIHRSKGQCNLIWLEDGKTLYATYCAYDESEEEALHEAIRTNEFDMTKITLPRHGDGTCDYESGGGVPGKKIVNGVYRAKENLRLRAKEDISGEIITTMQAGTYVRILSLGKEETIDGITDNWVQVETQFGAKNLEGDFLYGETGWCFGGYLK